MNSQRLARQLAAAVTALAVVFLVGVIGYIAIERWSLLDALYMTTITVGQVGFGEVGPLSTAGRVFTIILIFAGVGAFAFVLATLIDLLVSGNIRGLVERRRMEKQLAAIKDHTIVAGIGRVGSEVVRLLAEAEAPFLVVDTCEECIARARELGWLHVEGDATEEEVLKAAGVERAGSLVSTLDTDAENLFVTVSARAMNPDIFIVARSTHESSEPKLLRGGADRVITPNVIGGRRMASMILHPVVADYLDLVAHGDGVEFRLQEIVMPEGSQFADMTIAEAGIREKTGAYILAIRNEDGSVDTNPMPDTRLVVGQRLVVLGTQDQVAEFVRGCMACKLR